MRHSYEARLDALFLRPLKQSDIELLRKWRNDQKISRFFRKIGFISAEQQLQWYQKYLINENDYYWAIVENYKTIGALSIYDISDTNAEIGRIMIGDINARGKGYGYKSLIMAMKIGFQRLGLQAFQLNVHEKNIRALRIYERAGFNKVGLHPFDLEGNEYEMSIDLTTFECKNPMSKEILF